MVNVSGFGSERWSASGFFHSPLQRAELETFTGCFAAFCSQQGLAGAEHPPSPRADNPSHVLPNCLVSAKW